MSTAGEKHKMELAVPQQPLRDRRIESKRQRTVHAIQRRALDRESLDLPKWLRRVQELTEERALARDRLH